MFLPNAFKKGIQGIKTFATKKNEKNKLQNHIQKKRYQIPRRRKRKFNG